MEFLTLHSPVYGVLMVLNLFPFALSCPGPCGCFHSFSFSPAAFRSAFPVLSPMSLSSLHKQKQFPTLQCFSLPQFTSPCHVPAEFCGSNYADCCTNLPRCSAILVSLFFPGVKVKLVKDFSVVLKRREGNF